VRQAAGAEDQRLVDPAAPVGRVQPHARLERDDAHAGQVDLRAAVPLAPG
jgi:hypothetical protein